MPTPAIHPPSGGREWRGSQDPRKNRKPRDPLFLALKESWLGQRRLRLELAAVPGGPGNRWRDPQGLWLGCEKVRRPYPRSVQVQVGFKTAKKPPPPMSTPHQGSN